MGFAAELQFLHHAGEQSSRGGGGSTESAARAFTGTPRARPSASRISAREQEPRGAAARRGVAEDQVGRRPRHVVNDLPLSIPERRPRGAGVDISSGVPKSTVLHADHGALSRSSKEWRAVRSDVKAGPPLSGCLAVARGYPRWSHRHGGKRSDCPARKASVHARARRPRTDRRRRRHGAGARDRFAGADGGRW